MARINRRIRTRLPTCLSTRSGTFVAIAISAADSALRSPFPFSCRDSNVNAIGHAVWSSPQPIPPRGSTEHHNRAKPSKIRDVNFSVKGDSYLQGG